MKLVRIEKREDGIIGKLYDDEGGFFCSTLEHSYDCEAKLPVGVYTCERGPHRLSGMTRDFETFEVLNVPGHTGILFHWGNWNRDSTGCILVGRQYVVTVEGAMVTRSRLTFERFMALHEGVNQFQLTVTDAVQI